MGQKRVAEVARAFGEQSVAGGFDLNQSPAFPQPVDEHPCVGGGSDPIFGADHSEHRDRRGRQPPVVDRRADHRRSLGAGRNIAPSLEPSGRHVVSGREESGGHRGAVCCPVERRVEAADQGCQRLAIAGNLATAAENRERAHDLRMVRAHATGDAVAERVPDQVNTLIGADRFRDGGDDIRGKVLQRVLVGRQRALADAVEVHADQPISRGENLRRQILEVAGRAPERRQGNDGRAFSSGPPRQDSGHHVKLPVGFDWHHGSVTIIKVNAITVPPDSGDELAHRFAARAGAVDGQDGFEGFELFKPTDERSTWLVVTRWRDEGAFQAWVSSPAFAHGHRSQAERHGGDALAPVSTHSELWSFEVAGGSN